MMMSNPRCIRLTLTAVVVAIALSTPAIHAQSNPYHVVANHFKLPV